MLPCSCWYRRRDPIATSETRGTTWTCSGPLCGNVLGFGQEALEGENSVVAIIEAIPDGTILLIPAHDVCLTRGPNPVFRDQVFQPTLLKPKREWLQPVCPICNGIGCHKDNCTLNN